MPFVALTVLSASTARANGRFPRAERLIEDPGDANRLTLAATYGLVTTNDRGRSWFHICEASFAGVDQYVGDPLVDYAGDGSLLVDVQTTLNVSRDHGCSWSTTLGGPTESLPDFAVARQTHSSILALRTTLQEASVVVHLTESTDSGATFVTVGGALPLFAAFTIDAAPSDPSTIYVSGTSASGTAQLLVSTDHGATWASTDIATNPVYDETPYIAAIHPTDPKKVFVRTDAWDNQNGTYVARDALLYTDDGGKTWTELYRAAAKLFGFALSPDASTVLIGYGNPRDSERQIDDSVTGVYRSATMPFAFGRIVEGSITCLSWTTTGVYVCTDEAQTGYALGFAHDSNFGSAGSGLQPLLNLADIVGPPCCGGATEAVCAASWSTSCGLFGACGDGGGRAPSSCSIDGGAGETLGSPDGGRSASPVGGCACWAYGSSRGKRGASLAGLLIVWIARERRRRSSRPTSGEVKYEPN